MEITSVRNPLLQKIRKAVANGRPTEDGLVVAEGPHLLEEALRGAWPIVHILTTAEGRAKYADLMERSGVNPVEVSARAFEATAETQHSQQVLALLEPHSWSWSDLVREASPLVVALDGIQDPGNAGTIVRSAEAFGATGVVFLKGSAHASNGKLLRASAGSMFRVPFVEGITAAELIERARERTLSKYALHGAAPTAVTSVHLIGPTLFVVGNEGSGVSGSWRTEATSVSIPTTSVESMNAAVAASIALFAAQQQRRNG
jgi:TrmH family RNA methyltransferase